MLEPKIYVACLDAYNSGHLHGEWIDANQDIDTLKLAVKEMLAKTPVSHAEEWAIHDDEGFGGLRIEEYTDLEKVSLIAAFVVENGELGAEVLSHTCGDIEDAQRLLEESYHGKFDSEEDFAYYWTHEIDGREIPHYLQNYIDYKAMAYDWFISDFFSLELRHKVHVFSNC